MEQKHTKDARVKERVMEKVEEAAVEAPEVKVGPRVLLINKGKEVELAFGDLATDMDAAEISDDDLKAAVAKAAGLSATDIAGHEVARVAKGNILISPRAVFGI